MNTRLNIQPLANKWWVFFVIGTAILALAFLSFDFESPPTPYDQEINYTIILLKDSGVSWLILAVPYAIGVVLYGFKTDVGQAVFLGIFTCVIIFLFLAWIGPIIGTDGETYLLNDLDHVTNKTWHGHVYNLASFYPYEAEALLGNGYVFYECDYLGIFCNAIYRYKPQSLDDAYADYYNPPCILTDDDELQLYIGGEKVFSVPVEKD